MYKWDFVQAAQTGDKAYLTYYKRKPDYGGLHIMLKVCGVEINMDTQ